MFEHVFVTVHTWESQDSLLQSVLSFYLLCASILGLCSFTRWAIVNTRTLDSFSFMNRFVYLCPQTSLLWEILDWDKTQGILGFVRWQLELTAQLLRA